MPDAVAPCVLARSITHHVPVNRIPSEMAALTHARELDAFDASDATHHHDVATEAGCLGAIITTHHNIAGEQPHLSALVDLSAGDCLNRSPVCVLERLA